jgi:phosphatidate cytidylyltransferase
MISYLNRYNNLTQRIITALIGGILIIASVAYNEWAYFGVFMVVCVLTQLEFYRLLFMDGNVPLKFWGTVSGLTFFCLTFLIEKQIFPSEYYFALFPVMSVTFFIKLYKKTERKPFTNIAFTFLGTFYVAVPFGLLNVSAFSPSGKFDWQLVLGILVLHWASDSGAYFAGVKFGRTKLFERVSPKKSWEGFMGGAVSAIIISMALAHFTNCLSLFEWIGVATIIVIAGTYGDLVESLFKRSIDIKDSGVSIPGHGGFLDRFDGLLLSSPFIATFLKIL